jgi:hypothetical protein
LQRRTKRRELKNRGHFEKKNRGNRGAYFYAWKNRKRERRVKEQKKKTEKEDSNRKKEKDRRKIERRDE